MPSKQRTTPAQQARRAAAHASSVRRVVEEACNNGNLAVLDALLPVPTCADAPEAPGWLPLRQRLAAFRAAVPDARWTIVEQIAAGDTVVTRLAVQGTFAGPLLGLAPPGRPATLTGVAISRFAEARLVNLWLQADLLGLLQQLGVMPHLELDKAVAVAQVLRAGALMSRERSPPSPPTATQHAPRTRGHSLSDCRRVATKPHERNSTMETALRPYAIHRDEGEKLSFFGALTWIKATGAQTGGAFGLTEQLMPPGVESPWHCHHAEDESFYVVEGEVLFIIGDEHQRITAGPGTFVFGPREIPHGFRVEGSSPARMLIEATPAGFETFVLALSEPAPASGFPPAGPPDMEKLMAAAARANIEILGPLPE